MAKMCTLKELRTQFGDFGWVSSNQCPTKYQAVSQGNNRIKVSSSYADNQLFPLSAASLAQITYQASINSGTLNNNTRYGVNLLWRTSINVTE